jgi:glycosyltransferase involved in cell wall biosynthesis
MAPRVLVLTSSYPTHAGSVASSFLQDWVTALEAQGYDATVLAPEDPEHRVQQPDDSRTVVCCFRYFPYGPLQTLAYNAGMYDNVLANPLLIAHLPAFLGSFLHHARLLAHRSDVMHAHWLFPAGVVGALVKRQVGIPLIVTVHSTDYHLLRRVPGGRLIARFILEHADQLHFVTNYHRQRFAEWLGQEDRIGASSYVVPMGVPDTMTAPAVWPLESPPRIGFLGRLIQLKGVDRLLRACAALENVSVTIAGCGPERQNLTRLAHHLQVKATFEGALAGPAKIRFIDRCDILICPSREYRSGRTEGLPVSVLEALARGRVVVASDAGGVPEIVQDRHNGYLFRAQHDEDLTKVLTGIVGSWPQAGVVAAAARQTGCRLTASTVARRHDAVYRNLLAPSEPEELEAFA